MSSKLRKTRTMQKTAEEGTALLKNAWGEDKLERVTKNIEARHEADASSADESKHEDDDAEVETPKKKPKLAKNMTMAATAEEGKVLLDGVDIDVDAKTRNQSKTIKELTKPVAETRGKRKAPAKKAAAAAKAPTASKAKPKKAATKKKPAAKKAAASKKPKLSKSRTMKETAKEGKAYLKSLKKKK